MSEQIAIRIPEQLASSLEDLVVNGRFETKAEAVRTALEAFVVAERRRAIGEQIVEGYRRLPQDDGDLDAAREAALRSIEDEPW